MAPVKSKTSRFPVARIKKIMQTDEDVGKLSSSTPAMVSKSVECFVQYLIDETCNDAKSKGAAKIMPHHLKATINRLETFDFLRPLVASVPEPAADDPDRAKRKSSKAGHSNDGSNKTRGATGSKGRASRKVPPEANAGSLPMIGTWKKEEEGGVGSGQDGRGLYDDYEEDEEDY